MKHILLIALSLISTNMLFGKAIMQSIRGNELVVEYILDDWSVNSAGEFNRIEIKGMDFNTDSGAPLIPYGVIKIGIPPSGSFSYSILESDNTATVLSKKLQPVPTITKKDGMSTWSYKVDSAKYSKPQQEIVQVENASYRDYNLALFKINPFVYDGNTGLKVYTRLLIKITLHGDLTYRSAMASDSATDVILEQMLNAEQAKFWRGNRRAQVNYAEFGLSDYWIRVETNRDGMHRLNYSDISSFPMEIVDPRTIRMFSTSGSVISNEVVQPGPEFREIPIYITNEASGVFGTTDYILFYGNSRDGFEYNSNVQSDALYMNPYSRNQVFWLSFGNNFGGTPLRITMGSVETSTFEPLNNTPAYKHVESETHRREEDGFTWYGSKFFGNSNQSYLFQTELSDVDTTGTQNLTFRIRQEDVSSSLTHGVSVELNGVLIKNNINTGSTVFNWAGTAFYNFNKSLKGFVNGNNSIKLNIIRSETDNLYFDWYRITYRQNLIKGNTQKLVWNQQSTIPRAYQYNLSGSTTNLMIFKADSIYDVKRIPLQSSHFVATGTTNTRYFLLTPAEAFIPAKIEFQEPIDLTEDISQIDNIIITPPEYISRANILAQKYMTVYGVRSRVISQDDIMNQFNGGHPDPAAIRQVVRYFYYNLPAPKLSSITLLGLGTIDWRNYSGTAATKNKIMAWQLDNILVSKTTSDDFYTMVSTNIIPELAIGRYPVRSAAELDIMIQNLTNYTEQPTPGWWRNSMLFVGDDLNNGESINEFIHTEQAEEAGNKVHNSILVDKVLAWEYEYDEFQNKPKARNDMFSAINEGRLLWCYIGHGSYDQLGAEDYLNGAVDMGRFANNGKLPLFIASSCSISHFDHWGYDSLGQKVVLMDNLGAIASIGATRVSFSDSNQPMLLGLLDNLANQQIPLGASIQRAKAVYMNTSNNSTYVLFGDPLLRIVPPERDDNVQVNVLTMQAKSQTIGDASAIPGRDSEKSNLLHARDTVNIAGNFNEPQLDGEAQIKIFDSQRKYTLSCPLGTISVSHMGNQLFRGSADVSSSNYNAGFVVPDDVNSGDSGLIVSYLWDEVRKKDFISYLYPLDLSDQSQSGNNDDNRGPDSNIYLGSYDFRDGDTVSTSPMLYAKLSDLHGINVTGASGHNILLVIDNSLQPIPITSNFAYDKGSFQQGSLSYQLNSLSEGLHTLQLIAFDNLNNASVTTTTFVAKQSSELSIERLLVYPNPMSKEGFVTFILSADAELSIGIYTIRGKRIRSINANGRKGFNSIPITSVDNEGAALANNTYFIKVKALSPAGKGVEKTEKMVIFK